MPEEGEVGQINNAILNTGSVVAQTLPNDAMVTLKIDNVAGSVIGVIKVDNDRTDDTISSKLACYALSTQSAGTFTNNYFIVATGSEVGLQEGTNIPANCSKAKEEDLNEALGLAGNTENGAYVLVDGIARIKPKTTN
jgi:hypothetical protein